MFCMYKAGNPDCLAWTGEPRRAFLDLCYSRTAVLVKEIFQLGVSSGFWGIPLASEILLLEYSAWAGQEEAGKEGNGLLCSSCSPASPWLGGPYPRIASSAISAHPASPGPARSKHKVKAVWFVLEQVFAARSSPARSRQPVLGTGRAYLTRLDAVDDGGVRVPPQPARAHDVLGEKERTAVRRGGGGRETASSAFWS